ncbi:response regulator transcription factor [Streptomyces sp. NPDC004838]
MSVVRDQLLSLLLASADRHALPLTVRQVRALADDVAAEFTPPAEVPALSQRQMAVLAGIAAGESVAETARRLVVSESTVKSHRVALYRVLGVGAAGEAVARAVRSGLLHMPVPAGESS